MKNIEVKTPAKTNASYMKYFTFNGLLSTIAEYIAGIIKSVVFQLSSLPMGSMRIEYITIILIMFSFFNNIDLLKTKDKTAHNLR